MGKRSLTVRDVMSPDMPTIEAEGSLLAASQRMHGVGMGHIPVVEADGRCLGVISAWNVVRAIAQGHDLNSRVAEVVDDDRAVSPDMDLDQATRRAGQMVAVVEDGVYCGALTRADVAAAERLARLLGPAAGEVEQVVSPNDTMYAGIRGHYLMAGIVAVEWIHKAMELANVEQPGVIVDLPCGHGRVMRLLRAAFPEAMLIACDLDREGVDFCARTFGAAPVYSSTDPAEVSLPHHADVIWVGSLLTHLPAARWPAFLDLFARSLRPGGLLVVTTLDRPRRLFLSGHSVSDPLDMLRERDETGHAFRPYAGEPDYGLTLTAPAWARARLTEYMFDVVHHAPRGWLPPAPGQDVWVCRRTGG